ncbi:uncharacterized protein NEMAJ01_1153 [Nematocida major]|uniref:uncharacterized protein n=1 Tax=Nematocida major TaxID=1912982 RepID=UPI002008D95C|nr:uncharacterized protein NEMAJ01_1153 [Nematocida major]KAH9386257.1 hypothetical protein NEMAJ01_1153 [Nematocida major]
MQTGQIKSQRKHKEVQPLAEDAIKAVLAGPQDYTAYRKTGPEKASEYAEAMAQILQRQQETEEDKENQSERIILSTWSIKLVCSSEGELKTIVFGIIEGTQDIVQSSFIKERVSSHCVMSKNTMYELAGSFDSTVEPYPGFRSSTLSKFKCGFPENWSALIEKEVQHIASKEKKPAQKTKPRTKRRKWKN